MFMIIIIFLMFDVYWFVLKMIVFDFYGVYGFLVMKMQGEVVYMINKFVYCFFIFLFKGLGLSRYVLKIFLGFCREDLIDVFIETVVFRMQFVIELGRVIRERNIFFFKYFFKEVVVIYRDFEVLNDIKFFQFYIMEEFNVREVKVIQDKFSYGVYLVVEVDFKTLGVKLKVKVNLCIKEMGIVNKDVQGFGFL